MKHLLVFWLLIAAPLGAQNIGYGIRGGIPLTDTFNFVKQFSLEQVKTSRFTIGPTFEVRLPLGLSFQVDALYKRHKDSGNSGNTWEIPLLAKYRFPGLVARTFVEAGVSFQSIGDITKFATKAEVDKNRRGIVVGAGVEAKLLKLRIAPEIRFTRWGETKFQVNPIALLNSSSQAEFLVGVTF